MSGTRTPRIGFLGVGWIGRHRMEAMLATGLVEAAAISDPSPEMMAEAAALLPEIDLPEPTVLPLERFDEAIRLFRAGEALKVVLRP